MVRISHVPYTFIYIYLHLCMYDFDCHFRHCHCRAAYTVCCLIQREIETKTKHRARIRNWNLTGMCQSKHVIWRPVCDLSGVTALLLTARAAQPAHHINTLEFAMDVKRACLGFKELRSVCLHCIEIASRCESKIAIVIFANRTQHNRDVCVHCWCLCSSATYIHLYYIKLRN